MTQCILPYWTILLCFEHSSGLSLGSLHRLPLPYEESTCFPMSREYNEGAKLTIQVRHAGTRRKENGILDANEYFLLKSVGHNSRHRLRRTSIITYFRYAIHKWTIIVHGESRSLRSAHLLVSVETHCRYAPLISY